MTGEVHIQVWFIDEKTGQTFAQTKLPAQQLPQRFAETTTMQLGGTAYEVVSATPRTAPEFRRTGELRLVLRKQAVQGVNPRDILYSLPSLSDELPALEPAGRPGLERLELHEDDWRQVELVSLPLQDAVERDLRAIERIHTAHREPHGFNALHVRKEVPRPLEGAWFSGGELRAALGEGAVWLGGVGFHEVDGQVAGGFAARLPSGLAVYGFEHEGRVRVLGLHGGKLGAAREGDARLLAALATQRQLLLVDWCRVELLPASATRFQGWLDRRS